MSEKKSMSRMENKLENTEVVEDRPDRSHLYLNGNFISLIWISSKK